MKIRYRSEPSIDSAALFLVLFCLRLVDSTRNSLFEDGASMQLDAIKSEIKREVERQGRIRLTEENDELERNENAERGAVESTGDKTRRKRDRDDDDITQFMGEEKESAGQSDDSPASGSRQSNFLFLPEQAQLDRWLLKRRSAARKVTNSALRSRRSRKRLNQLSGRRRRGKIRSKKIKPPENLASVYEKTFAKVLPSVHNNGAIWRFKRV